jgi:cytochrome c-type biogenesis protein CcmH/NrfG
MSAALPKDFCPYKGLQPYTEGDRAFFFGRERDTQVVISNLYAAPLTVFYGASGVGKSSVLLAGAVPLLQKERNVSVVVFRNWQDPNFLSQLKQCTLEAVSAVAGKPIGVDLSLSLNEFLSSLQRTARGLLFFIFDQFEEYFLYNPNAADAERFEGELAQAINRRDLNVNFLVSMREDGLSKLDRFQSRIPTLMSNMLRLEHLDRDGAQAAIVQPLEVYNRQLQDGQPHVSIEDPLVKAILNDLRGVKVTSDQTGEGALQDSTPGSSTTEIETPLLQMVLTRLWDEEHQTNSNVLRLKTFETLGRAANIVRTHLDTVMARLNDAERNEAADVLRYMVTPSGTKIAQETSALASWSELPETKVQNILNRLGAPDMRILRTVQAPEQPVRYEVFHDVLARAILDWRSRYVARQQQEKIRQEEQARMAEEQEAAERRREKEKSRLMRRALLVLSTLFLLVVAALSFALVQTRRITKARQNELDAIQKAQKAAADAATARNNQLQAALHSQNGYVFLVKRKFADAEREYGEAIKLAPDDPTLYNSRGYALMRDKRYPEAIAVLGQAIAKDDRNIWAHYNLAQAYKKNGNEEAGMQECEKVLDLDSTFCDTFIKDGNYNWFVCSTRFSQRCGNQTCKAPQSSADSTSPSQ